MFVIGFLMVSGACCVGAGILGGKLVEKLLD